MSEHILPRFEEFERRCSVHGAAQTEALGRKIATLLEGGEILLLYGLLGSGKTCLTQGLCRELGVIDEVVSPTFTLVNTHTGRLTVHHVDCYRVGSEDSLEDIGIPDLLDEVCGGKAVLVAEWPQRLLAELQGMEPCFELLAALGPGPEDRTWSVRCRTAIPAAWLEVFNETSPSKE